MRLKKWMEIKKGNRRRIVVYGSLIAGLWGFYVWQPWEYDFVQRQLPKPNPPVSPDPQILFSPKARVVVITAHPDDSEFYLGGLTTKLAKAGAEMYHIVITDGDKGYYPFEDYQRNRRVRRLEQIEASTRWKAKQIIFLSYPDGRLRVTEKLQQKLLDQLNRIQPNYILAFDGNYPPRFSHQDHRRAGDASQLVAPKVPSVKWLLKYSTSAPNYIVDTSDEFETHMDLLAVHKSQFFGERLQKIRDMIRGDASQTGEKIDVAYGVGLRAIKIH